MFFNSLHQGVSHYQTRNKERIKTYNCTCLPTFISSYFTSSPSSRPKFLASTLRALALPTHFSIGAKSKSELRCQKKVELILTNGLSGHSFFLFSIVSIVAW